MAAVYPMKTFWAHREDYYIGIHCNSKLVLTDENNVTHLAPDRECDGVCHVKRQICDNI